VGGGGGGGGVQVDSSYVKLARVENLPPRSHGFSHSTLADREQQALSLDQLNLSTTATTKDLHLVAENQLVCTNRLTVHAKIDWKASGSVITQAQSRDNHIHGF
jgi:hypothetical protein